jgi:hypothetical protein
VLLALLASPIVLAEPGDFGFFFEPRPLLAAQPPVPDPAIFPFQLVLDDGVAEGVFGLSGANARQFLWLNRFANPGPFMLEEIWVLVPSGTNAAVGEALQLVVYLDPDGDPANGAQLLADYDVVIQAVDGATFSVFPLVPPLVIDGSGDVLIGAVNRYFQTGVDPPPTEPAALDTTASQNRSYFALWAGDAPDPPDLATATVVDLLDGAAAGNFLIRGFGSGLPPPPSEEIPVLGGAGLALLAALLSLAGAVHLRRRLRSVRDPGRPRPAG